MNWRFLLPNLATTFSFELGLASVFASILGDIEWAAWMILWAVLLDKLDGTLARLVRGTSRFGAEFDSFADFMAFGVAPAVLVFQYLRASGLPDEGGAFGVTIAGCALYALFNAIRLVRFNLTAACTPSRWFAGVPTTLCGALVSSGILLCLRYGLSDGLRPWLPALLSLLGLGMVSRWPIPKLVPRKNLAFNLFQMANILGAYACGILRRCPEYLMGLALLYLSVGLAAGLILSPAGSVAPAREAEESNG